MLFQPGLFTPVVYVRPSLLASVYFAVDVSDVLLYGKGITRGSLTSHIHQLHGLLTHITLAIG